MNKTLLAIISLPLLLLSCAESYTVEGTSSVTALDGSTMYLRTLKDNEMKTLDSCDVVHGQFALNGVLDTVRWASLYVGEESVMPIVIEKGQIMVTIDAASLTAGGTPLNDKLYEFIKEHSRLESRMNELARRQSQMMLEGIDEDIINEELLSEAKTITDEEDKLVTSFIVENFDNVLGPSVFMMLTSGYVYPVLTPQIEDIMSKATEKFKNDPYVKEYYSIATENEARMQGIDVSGGADDDMDINVSE